MEWKLLFCAVLLSALGVTWGEEQEGSYQKNVLMDLCQFIGVSYVRNPETPECGYIACWDRAPYHMPCAPGLRVHPLFFWGDSYPCTEKDAKNSCNYVKRYFNGEARQAGSRAKASSLQAKPAYRSTSSSQNTGYTRPYSSSNSGGSSTGNAEKTSTYAPTVGK